VLGVKLRHLDGWNSERRRLAERYSQALRNLPLMLPREGAAQREHAWHLYVVRHGERDRLARELREAGVATGVHYPIPVHLQNAYRFLGYRAGDFPEAEAITRECLSLPLYPGLLDEEQGRVIDVLCECLNHRFPRSLAA